MLLDPQLTAAYLVVAAALAVAPGPDTMYVLANALRHKLRGALAAAFGVACGTACHSALAALGVSALVAAAPGAYAALRVLGAAYLGWLGVQALLAWRRGEGPEEVRAKAGASALTVFRQGLFTNLLNPKVIVFYLALLPQFVNPDLGHPGVQMFLLGLIHTALGLAFLVAVGLAAGRASDWLARTRFARWMDGIAGLFFIGLALRLAISGRPER